MPKVLRRDVDTLTIHKGVNPFGGGNRDVLIHTGYAEQIYEPFHSGSILEETLIHEAAHTSMDSHLYGTQEWNDAVEADGKYISNYAKAHPLREDIAESYLVWFATRCRQSTFTSDQL